jgi:hypothetical protein
VLGALAGLGFWTLALIAVCLVPLGALELWRHRGGAWRGYLLAAAAFVARSGPWWAYNLEHGWQGVSALCAPAGPGDPLAPVLPLQVRVLGLLTIGLPGLIGARLPWSAEWLLLLVAPPLAAFYAASGLHAWVQARRKAWGGAYRLLWGLALSFVAAFVLSRFGSDPTGRYFVPLYTPWAIFVAAALVAVGRKARWAAVMLSM